MYTVDTHFHCVILSIISPCNNSGGSFPMTNLYLYTKVTDVSKQILAS